MNSTTRKSQKDRKKTKCRWGDLNPRSPRHSAADPQQLIAMSAVITHAYEPRPIIFLSCGALTTELHRRHEKEKNSAIKRFLEKTHSAAERSKCRENL